VRNIVFLSAGGSQIRARVSNAGGDTPLTVGSASIGLASTNGATVSGTVHPLLFKGQSSVVIPAGQEMESDAVTMTVAALKTVAVSVYLPGTTGPATQHYVASQTNYLATGNEAQVASGSMFAQPISCWMFVSGVDVNAGAKVKGAVVTLGDSITDGHYSTANANHRYPDYLARRMVALTGDMLSVSNAGISGNEVLTSRSSPLFGDAAINRVSRDVLSQSGVIAVILLEGINDIGGNGASAQQVIAGYQQIISQVHTAGLSIYGGTLTPFVGSNPNYGAEYGTAFGEQQREAVNTWILTSGAFDGLVDFDKALRDPAHPTQLLPKYDSGDHLHPNDAGYQVMANSISLSAIP